MPLIKEIHFPISGLSSALCVLLRLSAIIRDTDSKETELVITYNNVGFWTAWRHNYCGLSITLMLLEIMDFGLRSGKTTVDFQLH